MRRKCWGVLSLIGALLAPASVTAAPMNTKPSSFQLTATSPVFVKVHLPRGTYAQVCFDFQFSQTDPVDAGEEVDVDVAPPNTLGMAGFVNTGTDPILARTLCTIDPAQVAVFDDGRQTIEVLMPAGSATVTSFQVTAT